MLAYFEVGGGSERSERWKGKLGEAVSEASVGRGIFPPPRFLKFA